MTRLAKSTPTRTAWPRAGVVVAMVVVTVARGADLV